MTKVYKPKSIMSGFKLGFRDDKSNKKFFAVPKHNLPTQVLLFDEMYNITQETPFDFENTFEDKFGRGNYTLRYYEIKEKKNVV